MPIVFLFEGGFFLVSGSFVLSSGISLLPPRRRALSLLVLSRYERAFVLVGRFRFSRIFGALLHQPSFVFWRCRLLILLSW